MRILLVVVVLALLGWGGYWFVGAQAVERGLAAWIEDRRDEGWVADYQELNTAGFPNRFDTTITELELADPETGLAWSAPFFQILALSYKPNHVIAVWPGEQVIATPLEKIGITSEKMQGSVVLRPGPSLELDHANFVLDGIAMQSTAGWSAQMEKGLFATRQTVGREDAHDIAFQATKLQPSRDLLALLDRTGSLPDVFESMRIDTTVAFDAPWNRSAIEDARPQITALELKELSAIWGEMDLQAAGKLQVDAAGQPEGKITVRAKNWREMLRIAVATGAVAETFAPTIERALELLAEMSGNPKTLDAPLTFGNGRMSFGPIPLGPAPRLVIR